MTVERPGAEPSRTPKRGPVRPGRVRPGAVAFRLVRNLGRFAGDALGWPIRRRIRRDWVVVRLDRGLAEREDPLPRLPFRRAPRPLRHVLESLDRASRDPRVTGVLLRVAGDGLGAAQVSSLERAISALRTAGKQVVVYARAGGNAAAWLGARADHFWMPPLARLDLVGLHLETPFLREVLDRLGIEPEVIAAGRYKSAGESLERTGMSPPAREALESLAEDLYARLVDALAARASDSETARAWIDGGPYLAEEAVALGLVDALLYPDELGRALRRIGGGEEAVQEARSENENEDGSEDGGDDEEARVVAEPVYARLAQPRFAWEPLGSGTPRIVWVPVLGAIGSGMATRLSRLLRGLETRDEVSAVVLRIDSPGGDAGASDLLWRAVSRLAEKKPVVASLGDTAASGGYYVAMAAREIVAEPTTLTGSIGVVLAAFGFAGLLERIGVRMDGTSRGRRADIYSPLRSRSSDGRALFKRQVDAIYRTFVEKAARGRGLSVADIERVAEGRVWTGAQAEARGLVDALGSGLHALERARALAGLGPEEGRVVALSTERPRLARLLAGTPADVLEGAELWCPVRLKLR